MGDWQDKLIAATTIGFCALVVAHTYIYVA